ncbi:unnamed protein product [Trichogramma brassicae]|uniref:Uncharacterized protein n=1 Tax=Trichogramma brassicae TaxID=86971 RepID=A0A6H5IKB4_9HYME|nr:unnamed protein product [Trichogramma brassicae]
MDAVHLGAPIPHETRCDGSLALLNALSLAFNKCNYSEYQNHCVKHISIQLKQSYNLIVVWSCVGQLRQIRRKCRLEDSMAIALTVCHIFTVLERMSLKKRMTTTTSETKMMAKKKAMMKNKFILKYIFLL